MAKLNFDHKYDEESSEIKNVALALYAIANELRDLGFGNAAGSHPGGLEAVAIELKKGSQNIADAISQSAVLRM